MEPQGAGNETTSNTIDSDNDTAMSDNDKRDVPHSEDSSGRSGSAMDVDGNDGDCSSSIDHNDDDVPLSESNSDRDTKPSTDDKEQRLNDSNNDMKMNESKSNVSADFEQFDVEITEEDYESIAIMIDELMKDDPAVRIKAIRSLPIISKALGEQRTRNELIPYITQMIDDDDEVLLVLMEEIYRLLTLRLIGGTSPKNNEHSFCLIPPFERLCCVEEKVIRDEAVAKFGQILHDMPYDAAPHYFDSYVLPLLKRLCGGDWHTARISGATLIANVFSRFAELLDAAQNVDDKMEAVDRESATENGGDSNSAVDRLHRSKESLLELLKDLVSDSIPIVRRSAMMTLGKMVSVLRGREEAIDLYLPLFKKLSGDDQDNVRVFAVETLLQFGRLLSAEEVKDHLLHYIRLLAIDSAWRVRYIAADHFIALCTMLDSETIRGSMINYFIRLLEDQEPEVRAVAISKIPGISKLIGVALSIEKLIPNVKQLVADSNKYARASLASIIIPFCYLLPHRIVTDHILQCILLILKDEFPNVRLHVISNICSDAEDRPQIEDGNGESAKAVDPDTTMEVEVEVEVEVEITVEIDDDGNEIEIDDPSMQNTNGRERKIVRRKRKRMERQSTEKMKKFDISLLEESIIPSVLELALDSDWRVRLGIVEKMPALAKQFGLRFFDDRLFDLSLATLEDNVADIRLSAASNQLQIARIFDDAKSGDEAFGWTTSKLIPSLIQKARSSKHYLHRIAYLLSFKFLIEGLGAKRGESILMEILNYLCKDSVANVRFKACQIVSFLADHNLINRPVLSSQIIPKLKSVIEEDPDVDVVYFATQCLDAVSRLRGR